MVTHDELIPNETATQDHVALDKTFVNARPVWLKMSFACYTATQDFKLDPTLEV